MPEFDEWVKTEFDHLGDELRLRVIAASLPSLGIGPQDPSLFELLLQVERGDSSFRQRMLGVHDLQTQDALLSALWLVAGNLDASHTLSQSNASPEVSYLHGIMHRREGDFGNAQYWFNRVEKHPLETVIDSRSGGRYVSKSHFCNEVAAAIRRRDAQAQHQCARVQWTELQSMIGLLGR
jgi:hypothetical protein